MPDPAVPVTPAIAVSSPPRPARPVLFWAGLLVVVTLFGILAALGAATDWWSNDESYTWDMIQRPARQIVERTAGDVHPPLHYLLLKSWSSLLPQPRGMRVFSMLIGLGALVAVALTGRRLGGPRLGLMAALLWALFPMFLHFSQEGRMYGMALCCETLALLGWALGDRRPRLGWALLTLGLLAAFYTHNHCLIFGAALVGGELIRSLWTRRRAAPKAARGTGPRWIISAGAVAALGYLPWFFVLLRQVHSDYFRKHYQGPTWAEVIGKLFYYSYHMTFDGCENPWAWAPGVLLLGLLPAFWLLRELARSAGKTVMPPAAAARPLAMVAWVGAAPFIFLVLYSMFVDPMFEITRHGLLFIPFLLFTSSAWLAGAADRLPGRAAALLATGVAAALSLAVMSRPRDADLRVHIDTLNDRAPLSAPIVFYPPVYQYAKLMWSPLPLTIHERGSGTDRLTSCTLVVNQLTPAGREEIKRQAKRTLAQAATVHEIYAAPNLYAYHLTGLPRGAIDALLWRGPETGVDNVEQLVGRWLPGKSWGGRDLQNMMRPAGELSSYLVLNPDCLGVRMAAARTTLTLPAADVGGAAFAAVLIGGYHVPDGPEPAALRCRLGHAAPDENRLPDGVFLVSRITECAAAPPVSLDLEIPEFLTRRRFTTHGDATPGVYLTWAGVCALRPEDCRHPGFKGEYFDVGALGDELFLRSGFNDAEGAPPTEVRWTQERFAAELPVWPGTTVREVVLVGMLPALVRERAVTVEVTANATGRRFKAQVIFPKSDYGEYVLQLPEPLASGVYRFAFTVGTFSPREAGQGTDDRRLGFFLHALGLR